MVVININVGVNFYVCLVCIGWVGIIINVVIIIVIIIGILIKNIDF